MSPDPDLPRGPGRSAMILDEMLGGRLSQVIKQLARLAELTEQAGGVPSEEEGEPEPAGTADPGGEGQPEG